MPRQSMPMRGRRLPVLIVGLMAVTGGAAVACSKHGSTDRWTGGPTAPSPIAITINPSALPVGSTMPTGIVVSGSEMILYLWGDPSGPTLAAVWRDPRTGLVDNDLPGISGVSGLGTPPPGGIFGLSQYVVGDGTLIEYGAVRGVATRVVSRDNDTEVDARYTGWSANESVTVFWLRRDGVPIPGNIPAGEGRTEPLPPERYPLITAYAQDGNVLATARIRPPATAQKGG